MQNLGIQLVSEQHTSVIRLYTHDDPLMQPATYWGGIIVIPLPPLSFSSTKNIFPRNRSETVLTADSVKKL